jgi:hypothetical protein
MPRVMLERPNYFQKLVDLGCDLDDLGTVTWNSTTRSVDVSGSVYLNGKGLTRLPFNFGKVGGHFDCSYNQLASLEGALKRSVVILGALTTDSRAWTGALKKSAGISSAPPTA